MRFRIDDHHGSWVDRFRRLYPFSDILVLRADVAINNEVTRHVSITGDVELCPRIAGADAKVAGSVDPNSLHAIGEKAYRMVTEAAEVHSSNHASQDRQGPAVNLEAELTFAVVENVEPRKWL